MNWIAAGYRTGAGTRKLRPRVAKSSFALALVLSRARAEDHVDYRYENYSEDGGRIQINTHGALFSKEIRPWLNLKGNFVYDGISGATPIGAPPLPGQSTVPKVNIDDIRRAGFIEPGFKFGRHTISPQFAISVESDYESYGAALTHSIDFNEKNTTLTWGLSHAFDRILPNPGESIFEPERKDSTDLLVGITQILGQNTVFRANATFGYSDGYLSDPYKRVLFTDFPFFGTAYTVWPEVRPRHRFRQVGYLELQQFVEPVQGAADLSYRIHHDDWGIVAHTVTAEWHQKITRYVTLSPLFRFYTQTGADFYAPSFPGDPSVPPDFDPTLPPIPTYYSADYRLSALNSYTFGVSLSIHPHERISVDFGYKRYEMRGTDRVTAQDQYPQAHVFSAGMTVWF
jgi:hypothetical protein